MLNSKRRYPSPNKEVLMAWKYMGKGDFIPGVPARDLSDKEVKELGIQEAVEASDLYKKESAKKQAAGDK
jgi:hypothetical protein